MENAMSYHVRGLNPEPFRKYFGLSEAELAKHGVYRYRVDTFPGFPCRISMRDLEPGETALLLNHEHLPLNSPYRARHAIFVGEGSAARYDRANVVPDVLKRRAIALRSYDARGMMLDADIADGDGIEPLILRLFENPDAVFLHAHNAKRGCYAGLIERT
jgi:hypothetical protein